MRLTIHIFTVAVLTVISVLAEETKPQEMRYSLELGEVLMESTELRGFPGGPSASRIEFHPGFRLGMGAHYALTPYFALEGEVAIIASSIDEASGLREMDAVVTQVPLLLNATFQYANSSGFTPFVGIGVGGSSTAINIDEAVGNSAIVDGSAHDFVFAWQATGGLKYELQNGLVLGLVYKYLWSGDAEWELDDDFAIGLSGDDMELDGVRSHSILAFVSYRF